MIKLQIEQILREKQITKVQFANMMNIKKQNVNVLLETNNIKKLEEIATVLGVSITDLWIDDTKKQNEVNGFIEFGGKVYTIKTIEDMKTLLTLVQNSFT